MNKIETCIVNHADFLTQELFFYLERLLWHVLHEDHFNSSMNCNVHNSHYHWHFRRLNKGWETILDIVENEKKVSSPRHRFFHALSQDDIPTSIVFFHHLPFPDVLFYTISSSFLKSISHSINILWRDSFACN